MSEKATPTTRDDYRLLSEITTRWSDNDAYGHVNNVVYYSYFDTAVNRYLIENGALDLQSSEVVGLVVETRCTYFSSLCFPDTVWVGLKVIQIGSSSVRYEIAVFKNTEAQACAVGNFVHVYVDKPTNRPVRIPDPVRATLNKLV